ncbi:MAG: hypothetical protein ACLP41_13870 [Acidimicrobiales bacterium]
MGKDQPGRDPVEDHRGEEHQVALADDDDGYPARAPDRCPALFDVRGSEPAPESDEARRDPGHVLQCVGDDDVVQLDDQRTRRQIPLTGEAATAVDRSHCLRIDPETSAVVGAEAVAGRCAATEQPGHRHDSNERDELRLHERSSSRARLSPAAFSETAKPPPPDARRVV